jgi:TonB family protein
LARAARSNYESSSDEFDTKRLGMIIGGGVAVAAVVVFLAFKMFGSKSEAPKASAPVVAHAPEYPPEVTDLVAQIEAALKADDFKTARADVDKLRQLSPSHPRLDFFDGLLIAKSNTAANARGSGKKSSKSGNSHAANAPALPPEVTTAKAVQDPASASSVSDASAANAAPTLPPETPVGITRAPSATTATQTSGAASGASGAASAADAPQTTGAATALPGSASPSTGAATALPGSASPFTGAATAVSASGAAFTGAAAAVSASGPASTREAMAAPASTPATPAGATGAAPAQAPAGPRQGGGEPPPVVQEAKLVRRVNPDYPSAAKKDGISGFVDLEVTVSKQGNVDDVTVIQSTPSGMFDKSAVAAVHKWKYDPRFIDGLPSTAHLKVRLDFGPNK